MLSHVGAQALWNIPRLVPDRLMEAVAAKGGVIGIEAAPHTTLTERHPVHTLDSFMEHFEYVKSLVGIDHVGFGPDTVYGDHVGLHHTYVAALSLKDSKRSSNPAQTFDEVEYVAGIENPTEGSTNIVRWLVKHGYPDDEIGKVMGGNALRVMEEAWA